MTDILQKIKGKLFKSPEIQEAASYPQLLHYERRSEQERARLHLRIDADGSGQLLVNASRVYHLNPTAAYLARLALEEPQQEKAVKAIRQRYRVSKQQATSDYAQIREQIEEFSRPDGACALHELGLEVIAPFSARPSAPYRLDLALTYRCNNDCAHCYNARPRDFPELDTNQWKTIIDRAWEIGIPHIIFTGGEPTLRRDLPDLIAYAESKGQITGLNTNGRRLSDPKYVEQLVQAGLDHVQITLESHDAAIHDTMVGAQVANVHGAWKQTVAGVKNALDTPLFVMTNTTMLRWNAPTLDETLDFLGKLGVPTIGLNALIYSGRGATVKCGLGEAELAPLLELARQSTEHYGQRLIWYTPTQYCNFDPMALELGVKGCTAALYNMCVEPDGAVLPCQSYYQPLGNLLIEPWEAIWNHELAIRLRERKLAMDKCHSCALLAECGGGCPLYHQANSESRLI
jgi:radical SAM protein with 4Fe4S-binding SPASM domain